MFVEKMGALLGKTMSYRDKMLPGDRGRVISDTAMGMGLEVLRGLPERMPAITPTTGPSCPGSCPFVISLKSLHEKHVGIQRMLLP